MSHDATGWAIKQRGLKPAAKVVLWHLCDRYHPDNGCFPSQERLADDCELSRSTLNDHLDALEAGGLILREQRRDEGTKRQRSTRYRFPFEPEFAALAAARGGAKPSPESGHGSVSENPPEPCPENAESRVRNPDTNLVREPVKEPERERARSEPEGTPTADAEPAEARPSSSDDPRKFEQRVKKLAHTLNWPGWAKSSTDWTVARFAALTDAERAEAERRGAAYLAHCGRSALSLGTYFSERKWVDLPPEAIAAADAPAMVAAPAFGAGCALALYQALLCPPGPLSPLTASERAMIASGAFSEASIVAEKRRKFGWPKANFLLSAMAHGQGMTMAATREALGRRLTQSVRVGSELWEAWRAEHERRGWPWLPDPGRQDWVSFPAGGPGGLAAFEQAVREAGDDGGGRQAA